MAHRMRILTEEDIRNAIIQSDDESDEQNIDDFDSDISDNEEDILETASEVDDELSGIEDSEEDDEVEENPRNIFVGKDGTEWKRTPYNEGKTRAHNIIRGPLNKVVLPPGKHIDSPIDGFSLFFNDEVIDIIVKHTNAHAINCLSKSWKPTDSVEICAFIGLLIDAGIRGQGGIDYEEFWDPLFGSPIYRACMSKNRFVALSRHLRFDDTETRSTRRARDKFAPVREIWDLINTNLKKHYIPGDNLTIDEQLVPFRGRVSFRQYMPSKPDKYGMKIWWICDSKTSYPLYGIPYLGQEGATRGINLAQKVVEQLCESYERTNRNITFDNYFTSFELAQTLLSKGLTCVGTLRKNKRCIPKDFLPNRQREIQSNTFGFRKNMTMVSYVQKQNRAVIFLSTMHHNAKIHIENKNKSEISLHYNSTKVGVDTLDQLCHSFSVKRKTRRWPVAQFYNLIDVCGVAANVIWTNLYPDWNKTKLNSRRKLFLEKLVEDLVTPNIQRRSTKHLSKSCVATINEVLENCSSNMEVDESSLPKTNTRRRCHYCPPRKGRASKQCCDSCGKNVCNEHSQKAVICRQCINK